MALARAIVDKGGIHGEVMVPGDVMSTGGESVLANLVNSTGNANWTAAAIASGLIWRLGSTGAVGDTPDTAANIIAALAGNNPAADVLPGTTFRLLVVNNPAFSITWNPPPNAGTIFSQGASAVLASSWREYLITVLATGPNLTLPMTTTTGSPVITFVQPPGQVAYPLVGYNSVQLQVGQSVYGTGIPAGATVLSVIQGQGGVTGVTLSANATATAATPGVAISFTPTVKFDGLRSGSL